MQRVVITGLGTINALSNNKNDFFSSLLEGKNGIDTIQTFDVTNYRCKTGGEVKNLDIGQFLSERELRRVDRASQLLMAATHEAVIDAGLENLNSDDRHRISLITGTTLGGMRSGEAFYRQFVNNPVKIKPGHLLDTTHHAANDNVMAKFGFMGRSLVISTACSASAHAIGYAFDLIRSELANVVIAGGFDVMSELTFSGFGILRAMTSDKIRPFDRKRTGLVLGEGAGVVVLEEIEHAKRRGATIYAEIAGYGSTSDAYHMTAPHPEGEGASGAIKMALQDAGISKDEVDYINAHGTATHSNDLAETIAIKSSLGHHAGKTPVSSIKSMIGHLLGAAGAVEAIAAIMSIYHDAIPPTINYEEADPECDLDYIPNIGREMKVNVALSNSFGFGGNNCVLAFKKFC